MRVRIEYTAEMDDDYRRGVRLYYGQEGLATGQELKDWFFSHGSSMDDEISTIITEMHAAESGEPT